MLQLLTRCGKQIDSRCRSISKDGVCCIVERPRRHSFSQFYFQTLVPRSQWLKNGVWEQGQHVLRLRITSSEEVREQRIISQRKNRVSHMLECSSPDAMRMSQSRILHVESCVLSRCSVSSAVYTPHLIAMNLTLRTDGL